MSKETPSTPSPALWRGGLLLIGLTCLLQLYAIWSRPYLPLFDLSNHAARHYLEAETLKGNPSPFYEVRWRWVPNLGGDLFVPPLMHLLSPEAAIQLAVTLAALGYWLGAAWFLREQGDAGPGTLLACLLTLPWVFNSQLFWGYFNFYSGLGLMFATLAHFSRLLRRDRVGVLDLACHASLVALLFVWHLAVWGDYGLIMGCLLLGWYLEQRRFRRALLLLLPPLPSLVLCVLYVLGNRDQPESGHVDWGTWWRKVETGLSVFSAYDWWADVAVVVLWFAAVLIGFRLEGRRAERRTGLLLSTAALLAFYLLLPYQLGSTSDTDSRLLPALMVCAVGFLGGWPTRRVGVALGVLGLAVLLRYGSVILAWDRLRDRLDVAAASFDSLEPGGRVVPVVFVPELSKEWPECQFVCWSVVKRDTFVPTLFCADDQQPLAIREPYRGCVVPYTLLVGPKARLPDVGLLRRCYDFVWIFHPNGPPPPMPEAFEGVFSRAGVSVWRVR
jgi:hypothetical protein